MRVAILGAGGTIAPAIVRDLAESDEAEAAASSSTSTRRGPQAVADRHGGSKARAARVDARAEHGAEGLSPRALEDCGRPRQLRQLPRQPRRDGSLPARGLPLPRPRWPLLDDRAAARARRPVPARGPAGAAGHGLGSGQDEPDGADGGGRTRTRRPRTRARRRRAWSSTLCTSRPAGGTSTRPTGSASPTRSRPCSTS